MKSLISKKYLFRANLIYNKRALSSNALKELAYQSIDTVPVVPSSDTAANTIFWELQRLFTYSITHFRRDRKDQRFMA